MSNSTSGNMKGGDTSTKIKPRPFISRQHPLNDPKDPFTAAKVNKELVDRLALKTYPPHYADLLPFFIVYLSIIRNYISRR